MLVSGIPTRNGEKHVGEIAHLSLDIMSFICLTNMPPLDVDLQPRIGFHTGEKGRRYSHQIWMCRALFTNRSKERSLPISSRLQIWKCHYF